MAAPRRVPNVEAMTENEVARKRRWPLVLGVLAAVVALVAGIAWWSYPAHRIERELNAIDVPDGLRLTDETEQDNGWICFDSCSYRDRFYVTTLSERQVQDALVTELRERGYEVQEFGCDRRTTADVAPYEVRDCTWAAYASTDAFYTSARYGRRGDGRMGVEISVSNSG